MNPYEKAVLLQDAYKIQNGVAYKRLASGRWTAVYPDLIVHHLTLDGLKQAYVEGIIEIDEFEENVGKFLEVEDARLEREVGVGR